MASDEKVEIIVIGDVYWDTVIVPLPSDHTDKDRPQNDYARIDRPAGAWLLETLIRNATKTTESDTNIEVTGYGKVMGYERETEIKTLLEDKDLKPDKCRRALTAMELYSKSDKEEKEKVYRIRSKEGLGWVAYPGDCDKYTVKSGDTLWKIAEDKYGDGGKYHRIVEANKLLVPNLDKIDPGKELHPGQELRIPRSWASNEKEDRKPVFEVLNGNLNDTLEKSDRAHRIVVISETENHIFRQLSGNSEFVEEITRLPNSSLVFCMASPLGEGRLWNRIKENEALLKRTLVVISAASLRSGHLYVREQAAQETIAFELAVKFQNPNIQDLINCRHVVVRFDYDIVFHFEYGHKCFDNYLRPFDGGPQTNPGRYGTMSGYGKILVASIVKEMVDSFKESAEPFGRLGKGICDGLRRGAAHFRNGFAVKGFETKYLTKGEVPAPFENLFKKSSSLDNTPIKELFRQSYIVDLDGVGRPQLKKDVVLPLLARVHLPFDIGKLQNWSRIEGLKERVGDESFKRCLVEVVRVGLRKALEKYKDTSVHGLPKDELPIACFFLKLGDLVSVERKELDGFNDVYVLIQKYLQDDSSKKPLSLGVFGPPGTGKSFAVGEILKAAGSASAGDILKYNLSGFTEPKNLARAFHKAQDVALSGKVPLVFFDEFDASLPGHPYAWLKYFLEPMQDGKFKAAESEDSYTVGRAIFVFAGGTADTFNEFVRKVRKEKNAKGPDFISRLRGHLNILSINDEPSKPPEKENNSEKPTLRELVQTIGRLAQAINKSSAGIGEDTEEHPKDESKVKPIENCRLLLRRAIILRSVLEREANEILDSKENARIDDGVINAFLYIDRYEHGTRSMEAIVKMARPDKGWLRVASLRSADQLGMHVDHKLFLNLARGDEPLPECSFRSERESATDSGSSAPG